MATPEEYVARLRVDLADPLAPGEGSVPDADSLWSDVDLYFYLNQAQDEFARQTLCFPDATSFRSIVTADDPWVALHERVIKYRRGKLTTARRRITPVNAVEIAGLSYGDDYGQSDLASTWEYRTGVPRYAITDMEPMKARLVAIPTSDDVIEWEVYRFSKMPIEDDLSVFEVETQWQPDLLLYAKYLAYMKQDAEAMDMKRAAEFEARWLARMESEIRPYYSRRLRRADVVRMPEDYS